MKKIVLIISCLISLTGMTQNLESKIPNTAKVVASVNSDQIFNLISVTDFNNHLFTKEIFKKINKSGDYKTVVSIEDFGFDINSKAYYFYDVKDSINYQNVLIKLNEKGLSDIIKQELSRKTIEQVDGLNIVYKRNGALIWNKDMILFTYAILPYKPYEYSYDYYPSEIEETVIEDVEEVEETVIEEKTPDIEITEEVVEVAEDEVDEVIEQPDAESIEKMRKFAKAFKETEKKVDDKKAKIIAYAKSIITANFSNSITHNKSFISGKKKDAVAYLWVRNYGDLMGQYLNYYLGAYNPYGKMGKLNNLYGINSITAHLFFDNNAIRMTSDANIDQNWVKSYKKMYNSKIGSEFFKHFDQNKALAYMSMSMSTTGMLEEYPNIVSNMYSQMLPDYKDETSVVAELMSIVLDEEAIGELITGNAIFILNDISEKEVSYTTYEYDEDYNSTEVTKTKMETIPDFTIMVGSKNKKLTSKFLRLGLKYKVLGTENKYFKVSQSNGLPLDVFIGINDKIFFMTTSQKSILDFVNNRSASNTGKHKKMIRKSITAFYVDGHKIMNKVPLESFSKNELAYFNRAKESVSELMLSVSKIKNNKIHSEIKLNTTNKEGNSLEFIFNFIDGYLK
jgi:hypothetical protein